MRIAIFTQNVPIYSGGRYLSWMMAEALVRAGHEVCYVTNLKPIFHDDFSSFPGHRDVGLIISKNFNSGLPAGDFDVVFLVPGTNTLPEFFLSVIIFAGARHARLVMLNFESPNWFNSLSPVKCDPAIWDMWKYASSYSSLILSISKEGDRFARLFYDDCPPEAIFDYCYPSINSVMADSVAVEEKAKRIILITRFGSAEHKGGAGVVDLVCKAMRGYTLVLIVGAQDVPSGIMDALNRKADEHGVTIDVRYKLGDREKFLEIKRASLMIFLSVFEGFGLPPVEAQYCNTPCICFDLPVLREVSGDGLIYVKPGDWAGFREKIREVLTSGKDYGHLKENISGVATIESYAENIDAVVKRVMEQPLPKRIASLKTRIYISMSRSIWRIRHISWRFEDIWPFMLMRVVRPPVKAVLKFLFPRMQCEDIKGEAIEFFKKITGMKKN